MEMKPLTLEGSWAEVVSQAAHLAGTVKVRLEVLDERPPHQPLRFGMFSTLGTISEEDIKSAQWQCPPGEGA